MDANIIARQVHGEQSVAKLCDKLRSIIEDLLDELDAKEALSRSSLPRSSLDEINQHLAFCQRAASCSVNRESALMAVKRFTTPPSSSCCFFFSSSFSFLLLFCTHTRSCID